MEADESPEDTQPSEERPQAAAKVGAKKQKKLEEKQARRAQREVTISAFTCIRSLAVLMCVCHH